MAKERWATGWACMMRALAVSTLLGAPAQAAPPGQDGPAGPRAPAEEEREAGLEAEFVASTIFQEASAIARLRSPLTVDGHYFGVDDNDIGMIGLSWSFVWRGLRVAPGLAWAFGRENKPAPVLTARWHYEQRRWLTDGLWVQSLKAHLPERGAEGGGQDGAEDVQHASILDGVHVSARIGRAELGPLVEHVQYREEREWKGGVRAAWVIARGVRVVAQLLGPDTELRGGLAWER